MGLFDDPDARRGIQLFSEITGLIALPVVSGALVGGWLDEKYLSDPWLIILGTVVGILVASVSVGNLVKKYIKK